MFVWVSEYVACATEFQTIERVKLRVSAYFVKAIWDEMSMTTCQRSIGTFLFWAFIVRDEFPLFRSFFLYLYFLFILSIVLHKIMPPFSINTVSGIYSGFKGESHIFRCCYLYTIVCGVWASHTYCMAKMEGR